MSLKRKQAALKSYLEEALADPKAFGGAAWAVYFLAGGKPRQIVATRLLRQLALDLTGLPEWLFEECYQSVGDLAETLVLLAPPPQTEDDVALDIWMNERLLALRQLPDEDKLARLKLWLDGLAQSDRLPFFKLITGSFRVGVSRLQMAQALAAVAGLDQKVMSQRMMGYTQANRRIDAMDFASLIAPEHASPSQSGVGHPYPFFLAHSLAAPPEEFAQALGALDDWQVEWKFDGVRAQYVRRGEGWWLWSRGEELVNDSFPDLAALAEWLEPGTVLDAETLVRAPGENAPATPEDISDLASFASLQQRLNRKALGAKILRDLPATLVAYDLLEWRGEDLRAAPQSERRRLLEQCVRAVLEQARAKGAPAPPLRLSPLLGGESWSALNERRCAARAFGAEGLMLKRKSGAYGVGRRKDALGANWWKWKLDPMSVDAVLIYAQRGHGRRSGVYSDYTFGVWDRPPECEGRELVPFTKAYSGLSDTEMMSVDQLIRKTTIESFGPVRRVLPTMVFELGFEGVAASKRHKSGISVRFPRMLRWRRDKPVAEADTLTELQALLAPERVG